MYTELRLEDIPKGVDKNFRLCYINKLPHYDYNKFGEEIELYNDDNERLELYFTNCDMSHQWGDDWDDAPYEYNAGEPYDDYFDGNEHLEHEIIKIHVTLSDKDIDGRFVNYRLPQDYSYNSPFTVEMINAGIVAWLSISWYDKKKNGYVVIHAGETMEDVFNKLNFFIVKE